MGSQPKVEEKQTEQSRNGNERKGEKMITQHDQSALEGVEEKENDVGVNEKSRERGQSGQTSFGCWLLTP